MKVEQLIQLYKHINIEDDVQVKHHMLDVAQKYIETFGGAAVSNPDGVEGITEIVTEDATLPEGVSEEEEYQAALEEQAEEIRKIEETISPVIGKIQQQLIQVAEQKKEQAEQESLPLDELPLELPAEPEKAEQAEDVQTPTSQPVSISPICVEKFSLAPPTEETQLQELEAKGGFLFRDKRSLMLGLSLDKEVLALAKTSKIEELPAGVQEYLKNNGFLSVDIVNIGKIEKKSKARYVDIALTKFEKIPSDHPVALAITTLLDKGEAEPAKQEETPAKEPAAAPKETSPVVEQRYMLNPAYVTLLSDKKEMVLGQTYTIMSDKNVAKLTTKNGKGDLIYIAMNDQSTLRDGEIEVSIADYTLETVDGRTYAQFQFSFAGEPVEQPKAEEVKAEQPKAEEPAPELPKEKTIGKPASNVIVKTMQNQEIPADFPLKNDLHFVLHPYAEQMMTTDAVEKMVGKPLNLGFITRDGKATIGVMFDVFEMAVSPNTLTTEDMRNSKWIARVTSCELAETADGRKQLNVTFDYLMEHAQFSYEKLDKAVDVLAFVPITEEGVNRRKAKAEKKTEAPATPAAVEKTYDKEAGELLKPKGEGNFSGAVEELRSRTAGAPANTQAVMEPVNQAITSTLTKTQAETAIHLEPQNQGTTTEVMGTLKDGAGQLTQNTTLFTFVTKYSEEAWAKKIGIRVVLSNQFHLVNGSLEGKKVFVLGKDNSVVGEGVVPTSNALFMDGSRHSAVILGVEGSQPSGSQHGVTIRLGEFEKLA